ncbi:carbohydrate ABC transporter permease [Pseudactinotalea terrae]|uniref:carbohydrate ABC transporter permease n=1 Tax=Pseudactinotalea terrae TaxID=1743262 RepID=UPI0019D6979F|nr:carbohydrate ABC transporter permease [Pseudactinotalea terrae]
MSVPSDALASGQGAAGAPAAGAVVSRSAPVHVTGRARGPGSGRAGRLSQLGIVVTLSVIAFVGLFPFLFMLVTSFKTNEQYFTSFWRPAWPPHLANYVDAFTQIAPYFVTTVVVAAGSIVGALALCTVAAFVMARYQFPGRRLLFGAIALLLMVPGIASLIPSFLLMQQLDLLNTRLVLMIPHVVGGAVLGTLLMKTFVEQLPQEFFDAALVDGASGTRMFGSIVLPLSLPVVGTIALVTVIGVWNDFFWPLLTVSQNELRTISVGLEFFNGQNGTNYGPLFAGYVLASLPLLLLFTFLSKHFLAGLSGGLTGSK